jgi:hypothetical protein
MCCNDEIGIEQAMPGSVRGQVFDGGSSLSLALDEDRPKGQQIVAVAAQDLPCEGDVYLIDHFLTFRDGGEALQRLREDPSLRERIMGLLELPPTSADEADVEGLMTALWALVGGYRDRGPGTVFFVMDEVGSRLLPEELQDDVSEAGEAMPSTPALAACLLIDPRDAAAYTIVWPDREVVEGEILVCRNLPSNRGRRQACVGALAWFAEEGEGDGREDDPALKTGIRALAERLQVRRVDDLAWLLF